MTNSKLGGITREQISAAGACANWQQSAPDLRGPLAWLALSQTKLFRLPAEQREGAGFGQG